MEIRLYIRSKLLRFLKPVSRSIGKVRISCSPLITNKIACIVSSIVSPGDVILLKKRGNLTNLMIPGEFKHAAIVSHDYRIIDAVDPAVRINSIAEVLLEYDSCAVLRARFLKSHECLNAARSAFKQVGLPYDFSFEDESKAFYCSELVTYCMKKAWGRKEPCPWQHRDIFGMLTTVPQDFYDSSKFLKIFEWRGK